MQGKERMVDARRFLEVALVESIAHGSHAARHKVGGNGNHTRAAKSHKGKGGEVVARKHTELFGAAFKHAAALHHVAGCFLDAHNVGKIVGKAGHGGGQQVAARAARHVVRNQRHVHCLGNGLVVLVHALLRGLVVIGRDQQCAVGARLFCKLGQADCFCRVVGTRTGQHRHTALDLINADFNNPFVFFVGQGGRFAGGSARNQTVNALADLVFNKCAVRFFVQFVVPERGYKRGQCT